MRKTALFVCATLFGILLLMGCSQKSTWQDGTYMAEFKNYDSHGYKDTLRVTVHDGVVTDLVFEAFDQEGKLKTQDEKFEEEMQAVQSTYPSKIAADLINQYLELQDIEKVDVVAGATYSSECFKALFNALDDNMKNGDTNLVLVDNVPEK